MGAVIPCGTTSVAALTVAAGTAVEFNPSCSVTLVVSGNVVVAGTLRMRPATPGSVHLLQVTGANEASFVGGDTLVPLASDVGVWVMGDGVLDAVGADKVAWGRVDAPLVAGNTWIVLAFDPVGWQVGDELAIAPTVPTAVANYWDAYDYPKVASISGRAVTLDRALAHDHPAVTINGRLYAAEVMNLTRNVRLEGVPGKRAHLIFNRITRPQTLRNVAIRWFGPQRPANAQGIDGVLGRYSIHFHKAMNGSRGSLVEGLVVRDTGNWGVVTHRSDGITVKWSIVHDGYEAGFTWDPSNHNPERGAIVNNASHDVLWEFNVASKITRIPLSVPAHGYALQEGMRPILRDSVAVGVRSNKNGSGVFWPGLNVGSPGAPPGFEDCPGGGVGGCGVWDVRRIVSHNNATNAFRTWSNTKGQHIVGDGSALYHSERGINHGAYSNNFVYEGIAMYGNQLAVELHAVSRPGSTLPLPATFRRIFIDQAGLSDWAVEDGPHNLGTDVFTRWEDITIVGYRRAAFHLKAPNSGLSNGLPIRTFWEVARFTLSGQYGYVENVVHEASLLRFLLTGGGVREFRRFDQGGTFDAVCNCRVTVVP